MTEDAKAAEAHAVKQCEIIQKRRDLGLLPYPIKPAIIRDFLAGVEHGRQIVEWRERAAWEAARAPRKIEPVFGVPGFLPVGQRYATFEDWKNEQEGK